jgi:NAD(P)-dependent dehydrogenase (short-subunit alcohol dehydrogenase family)
MTAPTETMHNIVGLTHQSAPVDTSAPYSTESLNGKTVLITGGASGFGAAFARHWASYGATIIVGDVNDAAGTALIAELDKLPSSTKSHRSVHCDVLNWQNQVDLFREAIRASPNGRIDAVVPCAGINDKKRQLEAPRGLDGPNPPPPDLSCININVTGVVYTVYLAMFHLRRRAEKAKGSADEAAPVKPNANGTDGAESLVSDPAAAEDRIDGSTTEDHDRHILLVGSMASLSGLPGAAQYGASKHALLGLFRSLRGTLWTRGIRINMLCPYFVDTPIMTDTAMLLLAGGTLARIEDVVDAATRLVADEGIRGRALCVGPPIGVDAMLEVPEEPDAPWYSPAVRPSGKKKARGERAVWEVYAHDFESVELFGWRYTQLLNHARSIRGFFGTVRDIIDILFFRKKRYAKQKQKAA